ncbi:MAG: hypothetical protein PHQ52_06675 [Candidatus Omnitrophica bacterium]|nr:hypothetical protein [Candidatus Omnitrophota bacterium]
MDASGTERIKEDVDAGVYNVFLGEDGMEYASVEIFNSAGEKVGEVFLGHYDDQNQWDTYNGYGTGTSIQFGDMKIDPFGDVRLDTGEIKIYDEDGQGIRGYVVNGEWLDQYILDPSGEELFRLEVANDNSSISYKYGCDFLFEDTDCTWLTENGFSQDDFKNIVINEKINSNGERNLSLEWKGVDESPTNWIDVLKTADERALNFFQGFGFVENESISQNIETKANLLHNACGTGTVITVKGRGLVPSLIKVGSKGVWNHTALLYEDKSGKKWVLDMEGAVPENGLRIRDLDTWLKPYKETISDISIGNLFDDGSLVSDLQETIERDLFVWEENPVTGELEKTNQVKDIPYDTSNLIGLDGKGEICSSLIVEVYKNAGHPLFELHNGDEQYQYSPSDVYKRLKLLGYVD